MADIVILQASPRPDGTVRSMTQKFVQAVNAQKPQSNLNSADSARNATSIEIIDVTKLKFNYCTGCMKCRTSGKCIFSGDQADIAGEKIAQAKLIVVASPVYWGNIPGSLKALFDRNVFRMMGESKNGIPKPLLKGKNALILTACTTPFPFNVLMKQSSGLSRALNEIFKYSGIKIKKVIAVPGTKQKNGVPSMVNTKIERFAAKIAKTLCCMAAIFLFNSVKPQNSFAETASGWNFYAVTDFGYYPKSDFKTGSTHFAPISSAYEAVECRTTLHATFTVPFSSSNNPLFSGNNFSVDAGLALTPISVMPKLTFSITPVAFLNFKAGANLGTAWELMGIKSLSWYKPSKAEYVQMESFSTWFYQAWASGTFMFDTAAIFPGEWNHVVMLASYELNYSALLNENSNCELFQWQTTAGMAEGWQSVSSFILGYQMPLKLSLAGIQADFSGYLNEKPFAERYKNYNGDFTKIAVSPLCRIDLDKKDSIFLMAGFSSRRSFEQKHTKINEEPLLTCSGREWFFERFACSWTHNF